MVLDSSPRPNEILVATSELASWIQSGKPLVILDARFEKQANGDWPEPGSDRIPGALYVDIPTELAGKPTPLAGRRPLPELADLQHHVRRWGINVDSIVVVYDDNKNVQAARVWWVLRWAGVPDVRLLDGGFKSWVADGYPVTKETALPAIGNVVLTGGKLPFVDTDEAAASVRTGILIDARGLEAYVGGPAEAGKPPSGHIPGAISAPSGNNTAADGRFRSKEELKAFYESLGVDGTRPIVAYCGSGVAATHDIFALQLVGLPAALYPGSWSAWSADPTRPVAVGNDPI